MIYFLFSFFLLYGSMNLYAFLRLRAAFDLPRPFAPLLLLLMCFMTVAPVLVRFAENRGLEETARLIALAGYLWMGLLFLFVSAAALLDGWRLLSLLSESLSGGRAVLPRPSARVLFLAAGTASLLFGIYGFFEARSVRTERIRIETSKIPRSAGTFTVVQISDLHLGLIVRGGGLGRILAAVKAAEPDLLVSTGDLVDGQINELDGLSDLFREVQPRFGKYAVTGNHEFYAGLEYSLDFTRRAGFTVLRGEGVTLGEHLNLAGVDDQVERHVWQGRAVDEEELLSSLPPGKFTLLLKHRPRVAAACGLFDLQLSGHTHRGQIFPFGIITGLSFPFNAGTASPGEGCLIHVSRGSGTWGPPMRVFSPPEVTVIEIAGRG